MGAMSASDAAPLPRLGEVFFDVRGSSRSMRLSWYADTGVAVLSIWQGGMCTGTFRLAIDDLPRMVETLQRGPDGQRARPPTPARPGLGEVPADATAGAPAVGPLPGGGLPDYDFAHAGYQAGPAGRPARAGTAHQRAATVSQRSTCRGPGSTRRELSGTGQYEAQLSGTRQYEAEPSRTGQYEAQPSSPGRYDEEMSGTRQYEAERPVGPYLPAPAHEGGRPRTGPYLPAPAHEGRPQDQPVPPRPRPPEPAGPAPFLAGPDSYQAEPPDRRAGYPADMPAEYAPPVANHGVPNHGVPNHGVPNHGPANPGAVRPDRYPDDPYAGGPGLTDYQDAAQPAYYPLDTSAPAPREARRLSDTDYQTHYGGAVTDDIEPEHRRESSSHSRPPGNRGA